MSISDEIDTRPDRTRSTVAEPQQRPATIDSLTGIRGVAAVWVFLTHYQAVMAAYLDSPAIADNDFLYNGFRGVDLFFVLSGFILMHVHGRDFATLESRQMARFYWLRFYRVYPLNTVILLALVPLAIGSPGIVAWFRTADGVPIPYHDHDFSVAGFVQSLFLAQTWTVAKLGEWNGPAWSLSAEIFAYAFFPMLAWLLVRTRRAWVCIVLAGASLAVLMGLLVAGHHTQDSPTGTFGLIRCVFGFAAGSCLARAFHLRRPTRRGAGLTWLSLAVIGATLSVPALNMFIVFGFAGLIYGLAFQHGVVDRAMSSAPAMFLGRISFSLYMIHYVPLKLSIWALQTPLGTASLKVRVACLIAIPVVCVLLAMLAYAAVELPFQRFARARLHRSRGPNHQTALAS